MDKPLDKSDILCYFLDCMAMVASMTEKIIRKPRNVKINPDTLLKARIESLRSKKSLGEWLEEAIEEKAAREERERQQK